MHRLHTTYHNLGSWKLVREPSGSRLHIVYHGKPVLIGAGLLAALCGVLAVLAFLHLPDSSAKPLAVVILVATGVLVPAIMATYAVTETRKQPLLTYQTDTDHLTVRDPAMEVGQAQKRVSFSSEHFREHSEHYFEFNIVVDGERRRFLSGIANQFKRLARDLEGMGFRVSEHFIKL